MLSFGDKFSREFEKKDQVQFVLIPEKVNNIQKTNILQKTNTIQLKTKPSQSPDNKQIQIKDIPVQISGPVSRPVIHLLHENSEPSTTIAGMLTMWYKILIFIEVLKAFFICLIFHSVIE